MDHRKLLVVYSQIMNEQNIQLAKKLLAEPSRIVIVSHQNPDGDAVGSSLGLSFYLKDKGHQVQVIMPNDLPDFLKWMPGAEGILIQEKNMDLGKEIISKADLIFTLDFNTLSRSGCLESLLKESSAKFIMIDHHQQPNDYAVITYSDVLMSSTSEMVYRFITSLESENPLTKEMATCIYTGILTDTGSFRFPSTSPETLRIAARLVEAGANNSQIYRNVFDTGTLSRIQLLGLALQKMVVLDDYKTAYITLTQKELDDHNFQKGDTEGFVNYGLSIGGIVMAAIFIENEKENFVKISFRSKGSFSVNEFARNHFNGGGHNNAAGGRSHLPLKETINEFISILPRYKEKLWDAV